MLSREQQQEFKKILEDRYYALREEIRQELLRSDDEDYQALAGRVHDLEEESVADLLVDINLASIDRHIEEIREIDAALMRIAEGTYGICEDTGEAIPVERLRANPAARRTREAQEVFERTHAGGRHHTL